MKDFRTPQQMQMIYETSEPDHPYVLEYDKGGQLTVFYGSVHSNDPKHPQWPALDRAWQSFLAHKNSKKLVFYEGRHPESVKGFSEVEALKRFGEGGLILNRANAAGITAESPEPDRREEVKELTRQHFSTAQIITYYFARQMLQWLERDRKNQPDWQKYARETLDKYNSSGIWKDERIDLDQALEWYKQQTGKDFDPEDQKTLYKLSDPAQSKVSAASGELRDDVLFRRIKQAQEAGKDIMVVYGSGHAIRLEPALDKLGGNKTTFEDSCAFCRQTKAGGPEFFYKDGGGLFVAKWDTNPERPGHALVIPKRHVQYFHQLTKPELEAIALAAEKVEEIISKTDLLEMYNSVFKDVMDGQSKKCVDRAKTELKRSGARTPDGFNDWINDGPVAGQSVPHLHWHILPRWAGDLPDPDGGMRHMFDDNHRSKS